MWSERSATRTWLTSVRCPSPRAYFRNTGRRAPHNLYVHPYILWGLKLAGERPPTPLFTYRYRPGAPAPARSVRVHGLSITWGRGGASAPVSYRWDPRAHGWARTQRGRPDVDSTGRASRRRTWSSSSRPTVRAPLMPGRQKRSPWDRARRSCSPTGVSPMVDGPDAARTPRRSWSMTRAGTITLMPGRTWIELAPTGMTTTIR